MLNVCHSVVRHRKVVVAAFLAATLICACLTPLVKVNYSLSDYLPEDAPSSTAIGVMTDSFGASVPNVRLFAEGIGVVQAQQLAERLAAAPGVTDVMWLGTAADVKQPTAVLDESVLATWTNGGGYLYQIAGDSERGAEVLESVREVAKAVGATRVSLDGALVTEVEMSQTTTQEMGTIMALAVVIVSAILLVASHSWFEPVIFLAAIGAAIIMNMGTNLVLGEISFVSQICGAVLQLAVSMDYAIVLLHTFYRCRDRFDDVEEAMARAMLQGFSVVLSSAAVTFFGFLSLCVMRFGIGVNLGIVLAKGIVFSFLSVMLLMPCLVLMGSRLLDRFEHRYLIPSLGGLADGCARIMAPAALAIAIIAIPAFLAESRTDFLYGTSRFFAPDTEQGQEQQRIQECFGAEDIWVIMVPDGSWSAERAMTDELLTLEGIESITSYLTVAGQALPTDVAPADQLGLVMANGWSRLILTTNAGLEGNEAFALVEQVRGIAERHYGDEYHLAGSMVSTYDLKDTIREDSLKVKIASIGSIGLVLLVMFRSLSIPVLMLLAIEASIWMNLAIPYFLEQNLYYIGYLVIDAVQLGAAVDYAIIFAREYYDQRKALPAALATREAISRAGVPILTSASILILAGVSIWAISSNAIISELGMLIGRGGALATVMMFLLLPWLLKTFDGVVARTSLRLNMLETSNLKGRQQ